MLLPLNFTPSYDILFKIALHLPRKRITAMRRIIAVISSCRGMMKMRKHFYEQKHLLDYNRPILNIWTPEINYYVADKQFALFIEDYTGEMNISLIYESNNTIDNIVNDDNGRGLDCRLFNITNRFVSVVMLNSRIYMSSHDTEHEICYTFNEKYREFVDARNCYGKLAIIDLCKTKICWSHKSTGALTDYYINYIQWDPKRNEIILKAY